MVSLEFRSNETFITSRSTNGQSAEEKLHFAIATLKTGVDPSQQWIT